MNTSSTGNILNGIATATPNKYKYCPNCGRSNYESFKYCPDCGEKLSRGVSSPSPWYPYTLGEQVTSLEHKVYPSQIRATAKLNGATSCAPISYGNTLESAYDSQYTSAVAKQLHYPAE